MKYLLILAFCLCGALATPIIENETSPDEMTAELTSPDEMTAELTSPDEMATELDNAEEITEEAEDEIEDEEADLEEEDRKMKHRHCKKLCHKVFGKHKIHKGDMKHCRKLCHKGVRPKKLCKIYWGKVRHNKRQHRRCNRRV